MKNQLASLVLGLLAFLNLLPLGRNDLIALILRAGSLAATRIKKISRKVSERCCACDGMLTSVGDPLRVKGNEDSAEVLLRL